jgi:hypothetical protein
MSEEKLKELEGRIETLEDAHLEYVGSNKSDYTQRHGFPESWPCKVDERVFSLNSILIDLKKMNTFVSKMIKKLEQ